MTLTSFAFRLAVFGLVFGCGLLIFDAMVRGHVIGGAM